MSAKLLVVSGPNRGATYFLQEGENHVGRAPDNQIVLASTQVSKRHCTFTYRARKVEMKDAGSSNGTFLNGVLTKRKIMQNRDRVSLGPFVLELVLPNMPAALSQPQVDMGGVGYNPASAASPIQIDATQFKMEEEPKSIFGKYKKKFDDVFLPVVYDFYERKDYATLLSIIFAIYMFVNLGFTVYPVLQRSREEVLRQAEQQAMYISRQVAFLNRQAVLEAKEAALFTDFAESELNVKEVVISNLEGRIMAPGARLNEAYNNPRFLKYRDLLKKNQGIWGKTQFVRLSDEEEVIAFTPIMVMSKSKGINVPGAIAVVVYSTSSIALDPGTIGTIYFEALVWSALLGVVFLYIIYQMTHLPITKLNDDMDRVLKGERDAVEKKYQNEVIDQLIDTVNSALSRIPKANAADNAAAASAGDTEQMIIDNMMRSFEYMASKSKHAVMVLDNEMRIKQVNTAFEELSGIRGGLGEIVDSVSRDESFPALVKDLVEKAASAGNEGAQEEYDFPSGLHKINTIGLSGVPGKIEAYLFVFEKAEG